MWLLSPSTFTLFWILYIWGQQGKLIELLKLRLCYLLVFLQVNNKMFSKHWQLLGLYLFVAKHLSLSAFSPVVVMQHFLEPLLFSLCYVFEFSTVKSNVLVKQLAPAKLKSLIFSRRCMIFCKHHQPKQQGFRLFAWHFFYKCVTISFVFPFFCFFINLTDTTNYL